MADNILDKIKNGEIEYREADEGVVTSTYITDDHVVQEPQHGNGEKLKKNKFLCDFLHKRGVPVPEVIEHGEDPFHVVFEKLEGVSLEQRNEFNESDYLEAVRNAGEALALIHEQEGFGYGKPDIDRDFKAGSHENWRKFAEDYVQGSLDYVTSDRFRPIVEEASSVIDVDELPENPEKGILHMDYTLDNVIVDQDLEVSVIDLDGARYGDPRLDLVYADMIMSKKGEDVAEAFRAGYERVRDTDLAPELEKNYTALAIMRDSRGGEWCLKNEKDVDLDDWSQGLRNKVNESLK